MNIKKNTNQQIAVLTNKLLKLYESTFAVAYRQLMQVAQAVYDSACFDLNNLSLMHFYTTYFIMQNYSCSYEELVEFKKTVRNDVQSNIKICIVILNTLCLFCWDSEYTIWSGFSEHYHTEKELQPLINVLHEINHYLFLQGCLNQDLIFKYLQTFYHLMTQSNNDGKISSLYFGLKDLNGVNVVQTLSQKKSYQQQILDVIHQRKRQNLDQNALTSFQAWAQSYHLSNENTLIDAISLQNLRQNKKNILELYQIN